MKRIFIYALIACSTSLLIGCEKPGCFGSAGEVITTTRSLNPFKQLILDDNINLVLTQDGTERMTIEAPENITTNISAYVTDNILTIENKTDCRWARDAGEKINVHLYFKDLTNIEYKGSGNISNTDTLRLDGLKIETALGAGDIELTVDNRYTGAYIFQESAKIRLHGKTETCYTYTNSRGETDLADLQVKKMVIEYGGLLNTTVNVSDELDAIIYYKGNINYRGDPVISRSLYYNSGRLIKIP